MRKMKESGIEWIGDIPEGWEVRKFKTIFSFGRGLNITKENLIEQGVPVVNYGQIHAKENVGTTLKKCLLRFVPQYFLNSNKESLLHYGDVVFADTSEDYDGIGNNVFIDAKFKIFSGYHTVICRPKITSCTKYIPYLFQTDIWRDQLRKNASGIKVFSITQKLLRDTCILLPPLSEQQRIADYLDAKCARIDESAELIRQSMEKLRAYKLSLITEAVTKGLDPDVPMKDSGIPWIGEIPKGWKNIKISYGINRIGSGTTPTSDKDELYKGAIPWITTSELKETIIYSSNKYVSEKTLIKFPALRLYPAGSLIIAMYGATIGRMGFLGVAGTVNQACCVLSGEKLLLLKYIFYFILCFKDVIHNFSLGAGQQNLSQEFIRSLKISAPPLPEQQRIADYLDAKCARIDALLEEKERLLDRLAEYKKSLIFECVTGKREVSA